MSTVFSFLHNVGNFCSGWKCYHSVRRGWNYRSVHWEKASGLYCHMHIQVYQMEGAEEDFILFCFFLTSAPLLACCDLVSEPQAVSLWLHMPEGSDKIAWSHRPEAWCRSGLGLGRGIFLLHSLHAGLIFSFLLWVPVFCLSRNMLFLFQGEGS